MAPVRPRLGLSARLYGELLRVYPAEFRNQYADQMVLLFDDQLLDSRATRGTGGVAVIWLRALIDLASNALGEHLRRNRSMALSTDTFEPTRSMRWLGLIGLAGGALLIAAFLTSAPFDSRVANVVRLLTFALGGAAIAVAFHRRQALVAPSLAFASSGAVVVTGVMYASLLVLGLWIPSQFAGPVGALNLVASVGLWLSATFYGVATLKIAAAWRGMARWLAVATRLGAVALVASVFASLGDDRLGLVNSVPYGPLWSTIAMLGVLLNGAGWVLLGGVLLLGGRGIRRRV